MYRRFVPLAAAPVILSLGCYEYATPADAAALLSHRVELTLTDSGAVMLASRIGPGIRSIEGTYLGDSAGTRLVAMAVSRSRDGMENYWRGEHVAVAPAFVASLLERRFSRTRTLFAGVLAAAGIGGMTAALRGKGEGQGGIPVVPPPAGK